MKRAKRLYILLGVLAVLCAVTVGVLSYNEKQEEIKTSGETILAVDPDTVTALSWENETATLAFHKDETWLYDEDEAFPTDQEAIDELLDTFEQFNAAFIIENVTDYAQYGLDDPICTIDLTAGENSYQIQLGDYSAMDSQRYVSIGDGNVYLAVSDPDEVFEVELSDLIDQDEVPSFDKVESISFAGAESGEITWQEYTDDSPYTWCADDVYFLKQGDDLLPLSTALVEGYLSDISNTSFTDYVTYNATDEDLATYGLDEPELTVTVAYTETTADGDEAGVFTLAVSRDPEEAAAATDEDNDEETVTAYARIGNSPILYRIDSDSYKDLMACGYDDLRHTQAFTAAFDDVTGLNVSLEGEVYSLSVTHDDEGSTVLLGEDEFDGSALESALTGLTVSEFTDEAPSGKEEIGLTISLDNETHPTVQLELYRYDGENCLAVVNGESLGLVSRSTVVDLIEAVNAIVL